VGIGKTNASESPMKCRYLSLSDIKIGVYLEDPEMSLAGARRLARRCPACRRREPGLLLLYGTWEGAPRHCRAGGAARGSVPSGRNR
jgi:hypothetical protein